MTEINSALASVLTDARLQTHHAAQILAAVGISFLPHQPDDSHSNLEWITKLGALASRVVPATKPFRVALRVSDLSLVLVDKQHDVLSTLSLNGRTMSSASDWVRAQAASRGAEPSQFTMDKHYTIPPHAVDNGAAFDASDAGALEQLSRWFDIANATLNLIRDDSSSTEVRCWPHHFDIATLIDLGAGTTVGVGMEPGDEYYGEPYYYVNRYPQPTAAPSSRLSGGGRWHTRDWLGAVLRGSDLHAGRGQQEQIQTFVTSAILVYRTT